VHHAALAGVANPTSKLQAKLVVATNVDRLMFPLANEFELAGAIPRSRRQPIESIGDRINRNCTFDDRNSVIGDRASEALMNYSQR
jgi:hypothetical protein